MTNFISSNGPSLKRPSSGRRAGTNSKKTPVADDTVPIYIQPFEHNNAWSTLINVSPQSTVAEARKAIQSKLAEEQARPLERWDYRARSPRGSTGAQREESPFMVYDDEPLSENMKLSELGSLKPYATLRLERSNFVSARRRRGSVSLVGGNGPTSSSKKSLLPISQSSSSRDSAPALAGSACTTEPAGSVKSGSSKESGSGPPKMQIEEKTSSQSTPEKAKKQEQDHLDVQNVSPVTCQPSSMEDKDLKTEHPSDDGSAQRKTYKEIVGKIHLFQSMEVYNMEQLLDALKSESFGPGEAILSQGDVCDKFYIVKDGRLIALTEMEGHVQEVMAYEAGDYFGELALLYDQLPAVSIVAQTNCILLTLDRTTFKNLIGPLNAVPDDDAASNTFTNPDRVHITPQIQGEFEGAREELDEAVGEVENSSQAPPAIGADEDDGLDELPTSYLDIGEMPLHSRPVSAQCQQEYYPPRCESAMSTIVPSPSPVIFDSLPTSPSPVLGNFYSNHDSSAMTPNNHDNAFQDLIKDLEAQVMRERSQREFIHDSFLHEQAQFAEEQQAALKLKGEMHEAQKAFQDKCEELESDERQQRTVAAQAMKALQDDRDTFKDREREWHKTKEALEQRCAQLQTRCWDLKEEQKAHEWRIEDQMQSEIQEVLRSEDQQCVELREQFAAELKAERTQMEDNAQYTKNELSVARASQVATEAVHYMITFALLKINRTEAEPVAPAQPSNQATEALVVEGYHQMDFRNADLKNSHVESAPKESTAVAPSQLAQHDPGSSLPSKEECNQLFPLQLSSLVQQHEDAAREQAVLKQECSELLPLLCQELGNLPSQSQKQESAGSSAVVPLDGGLQLQERAVPKESTDHSQLQAETERLKVLLAKREEEAHLLQEKLTTQDKLMADGRKDLEAQGEKLKNQIKQAKGAERHMRLVLFWSTYLCGCVCATVGGVMYFIFRDS
eukprot:gnl/MRDRNA2_/MRDRNA2_119952_c0_seq1.p1 gnl/MRDRNA2_/MRDRNA2_119952_c0~~gnl/MRDRNA2_/MRDRNA2_119952_c0_seq1.p1  ORF type:complete len:959 (-),score=219.27 gnl/MRDRNA2_/MRDRNA2_119952_c0_seq1:16-2892(-)